MKGVFNMAQFKTAHVKFSDTKYNYATSINPNLSDEQIKAYFMGTWFNLGNVGDNMQKCIGCEVSPARNI